MVALSRYKLRSVGESIDKAVKTGSKFARKLFSTAVQLFSLINSSNKIIMNSSFNHN